MTIPSVPAMEALPAGAIRGELRAAWWLELIPTGAYHGAMRRAAHPVP